MPFEPLIVTNLGGGLNFAGSPVHMDPSELTLCENMYVRDGYIESVPGWTQLNNGSWLPAGTTFVGMVPNLLQGLGGSALLLTQTTATKAARLWVQGGAAGNPTEVTLSGTAPSVALNAVAPLATCMMNHEQIIAGGSLGLATNYSVLRYNGTQFSRVAPTTALHPDFIVSAGRRLMAARTYDTLNFGGQEIYIAEPDSITEWDPTVDNSADSFELPAAGAILGMAPSRNGAAVLTQYRVYGLTLTGSTAIPVVVEVLEERGPGRGYDGAMVSTPYGTFYDGGDDVYVVGGGGVAQKVYRYLVDGGALTRIKNWYWHTHIGMLLIPYDTECWAFHPPTGAWSRFTFPATAASCCVVMSTGGVATTTPRSELWIGTSIGAIYRQNLSTLTTPTASTCFVTTKDFTFNPLQAERINCIKVDWECLTNTSTDAVTIATSTRDHFGPAGILGSPGAATNVTFTTAGTLSAGQSELPINLWGKHTRFEFIGSSGRVRIRSFALGHRSGGQRRT